MRRAILVMSAMMLGGCEMDDSLESEDDESVDTAAQDESGDPGETVIDSWSALQSLKAQDPDLYRLNVDILIEAGVTCSEADPANGFCLNLDEGGTETMLIHQPVRCSTHCAPEWSGINECWTTCCIDVIWEICGSD